MSNFICTACGTQYPPSDAPPKACPVCDDERQFVSPGGQGWTTLERLRVTHSNTWRELEPDLLAITTAPAFAIGERALLVRTPHGNILWDCIALLDDASVTLITSLGGIAGIAISHPHYYTTMGDWSRAFGGVPIHLHADDREWVMHDKECVSFWEGETKPLLPGLTLIRCGGHFPGAIVLHWAAGAGGRGSLLSGDVIQVVQDRKSVSFMRSFPNFIPLSAPGVERIVAAVEPYPFETIHGAFEHRSITADAKGAVRRSAERYLGWIRGDGSAEHD